MTRIIVKNATQCNTCMGTGKGAKWETREGELRSAKCSPCQGTGYVIE